MRLRRLELISFGHFKDITLDLGDGSGFQLVFGPNEAGKSTALRALLGLFFGIPHQSRDTHTQRELRVGAELVLPGGDSLRVQRRKGRKRTLLDADGNELDEAVLRRALGGVTAELYQTMFGLDHGHLRKGAEALLEGRGEVGESLFDAGLGGRGIHAVLSDLETRADAIFTPRARQRPLNEAIARFKASRQEIQRLDQSATRYREQRDALEKLRSELGCLDDRRRALTIERQRLDRDIMLAPRIAERADLAAKRGQLGQVPVIDAAAVEERRARSALADRHTQDLERAERELARLVADRDALVVSEALSELPETEVEQLERQLGSYRAIHADLPRRLAERRALTADVESILRRLGRAPDSAREVARVTTQQAARIQELAAAESGVTTALRLAEEARTRLERVHRDNERALSELPEALDLHAQLELLRQSRTGADLDRQIDELAARIDERGARFRREAMVLGIERAAPVVAALSAPASDAVEQRVAGVQAARAEQERCCQRGESLRARIRELRVELESADRAGRPPTTAELGAVRARRQQLWEPIREGSRDAEQLERYEDCVNEADGLADRMFHEADRVVRHARAAAELSACEREAVALDGRVADASMEVERQLALYRTEFESAGLPVPPWAEGRDWLARLAELQSSAATLLELTEDLEALRARRRSQVARVAAAVGADPTGDAEAALGPWVERLDRRVRGAQDTEEARRGLLRRRAEYEVERAAADSGVVNAAQAHQAFMADWAAAIRVLGIGAQASVAEAQAVLADIDQLQDRLDEVRRLGQRIASMEDEAARFSQYVDGMAAGALPQAVGLPPEQAADMILRSHRAARAASSARDALRGRIRETTAERDGLRSELATAHAHLQSRMQALGVEDVESLHAIEDRALRAVRLDEALAKLDAELAVAGEGLALEELVAEVQATAVREARARVDEIERHLEELQGERDQVRDRLRTVEAWLESLHENHDAGSAAEDAEHELSRVRDLGLRYARLRLAAVILRREVDRYREENQAPILRRASSLFPVLTDHRYESLAVGYTESDEPVLKCLRNDGVQLGVEALSDGTRDQLYLALRVATMELHAQHNSPLPLVLDDVLIQLDDQRARAALRVLGELSRSTQILFFTHHQRLVELAREELGDGGLCVHDLGVLTGLSAGALGDPRA